MPGFLHLRPQILAVLWIGFHQMGNSSGDINSKFPETLQLGRVVGYQSDRPHLQGEQHVGCNVVITLVILETEGLIEHVLAHIPRLLSLRIRALSSSSAARNCSIKVLPPILSCSKHFE